MNPAYMLRQMMQLYSSEFGVRTKITSLKPMWEGNEPDEWERAALLSFESGEGEVSDVSDMGGEPYLRLLKPLHASEGGLKCHAFQGYKLGDVRGGLGVYVSLAPLYSVEREFLLKLLVSHTAIWAVGMIGLMIAFMRVSGHIAERDRSELEMARSLKQKEVLLREVHHRVKNNMAIITSLLSIQSRNVTDEDVKRMLTECRGRIRSMALVHEKIYGAQDIASVCFKDYAGQLVRDVIGMYSLHGRPAEVEIMADEGLCIGLDAMIPLGLIINELVTNSMKHAFNMALSPRISIELSSLPGRALRFSYKDNGSGLPEGLDPANPKGMGLLVVNVLAAQIEGSINYNKNGGGMGVTIEMPGQNG